MSDRLAKKAAIKRATKAAQEQMNQLDAHTLAQLTELYQQVVDVLHAAIDNFADSDDDGVVPIGALQALLSTTESRLRQLETQKTALLNNGLSQAALLGISPFAADAVAMMGVHLPAVADEAVTFVKNFIAEDGLQLSDRIWRNDNHARQVVKDAINQAVIQGYSASRTAQELLSRGESVGKDLQNKIKANSAAPLKKTISEQLFTGEGSPYANALRLARTELNRAHVKAYEAGAFSHPDVIGTRFLLSPAHPKPDICDMHARVNLYGLGPGVYPPGKNPCPAHPNTLSYTEVVFKDELTAEDRHGKQDRLAWLNDQPTGVQESVLNSRKKRIALEKGLLNENAIATPWKVLKVRLERQGHNTDKWGS
jgi:hypothetical protein